MIAGACAIVGCRYRDLSMAFVEIHIVGEPRLPPRKFCVCQRHRQVIEQVTEAGTWDKPREARPWPPAR